MKAGKTFHCQKAIKKKMLFSLLYKIVFGWNSFHFRHFISILCKCRSVIDNRKCSNIYKRMDTELVWINELELNAIYDRKIGLKERYYYRKSDKFSGNRNRFLVHNIKKLRELAWHVYKTNGLLWKSTDASLSPKKNI